MSTLRENVETTTDNSVLLKNRRFVGSKETVAYVLEDIAASLNINDFKDRSNVTFVCEDLTLSQNECRAYIKGEPIKMTTKEYQLLLLLMKNAKLALSREAILNKVWGFEYDGNDRTIDTHIKMLRQSLGDYGVRIRTIRGMGYSFDGEVKER